ncbi:kinase-like domain-containing protein [Amylostereum chailletii]|nr:kinase-like domain-containing protein [Amylostereum chailletii]
MERARPLKSCGRNVHAKCDLRDLGDGRLVKSGQDVSFAEARAMVFVSTRTSIPVPRIFMVFTHEGIVHIVMELVEGVTLSDAVIDELISLDELHDIVVQLHGIVEVIRALGDRAPHADFGSWPAGPYNNNFFSDCRPAAPFHSIDEFHAYWLNVVDHTKHMVGKPICKVLKDVSHQEFSSTAPKTGPVLTHGDLAPRNILVRDGRIVAVLDWESFGWYPEFWEMMGLRNGGITLELKNELKEAFGEEPYVAVVYRCLLAAFDSPEAHSY